MTEVPDRIPYLASDTKLLIESEFDRAKYEKPNDIYEVIQDDGELPNPEIPQDEQYYVGSQSNEPQAFDKGQIELSGGNIPSKITDAKLFAYILGDETYDPGTKTHTIKHKDGRPETQTIQAVYALPDLNQDDIVKTYVGSVPTTITFNADNEDQLEATTEWVAHQATTTKNWIGEGSKPSINDSVYRYDDLQSNIEVFGDVDIGRVTDFEFEIDRNTFANWYVRQDADGTNDEWLHGQTEYTASVEVNVDTPEIAKEVLDNNGSTEFDINLNFQNNIGDTLDIILKGCQTVSGPAGINSEEVVDTTLELKFKSIEIEETNSNRSDPYLKSAETL